MDWFQRVSDFIYLSFKSLGPCVWIPITLLGILALVLGTKLMDLLKIPSKYQWYVLLVLFIVACLAWAIMFSKYPMLDWMED